MGMAKDLAGWLCRIACGTAGVAGVALSVLYFYQEKLLYVPKLPGVPAEYWISPDKYGLAYQDVSIKTGDGVKIHAWLLTLPQWTPEYVKSKPILMFFQENAGNMSFRLPFLRMMVRRLGCPVFAVSYRGYGFSEGTPNEQGLQKDAQAALAHLLQRSDVNKDKIVVFGRSLGGAVALHLTAMNQDKIMALILENTFTSVEDMVGQIIPPLGYLVGAGRPLNFLVTNKWHNRELIKRILQVPLLMLISGKDEMVPPRQMRMLIEEAKNARVCEVAEFPTAHHMDAYDVSPESYWSAVYVFIEKYNEHSSNL